MCYGSRVRRCFGGKPLKPPIPPCLTTLKLDDCIWSALERGPATVEEVAERMRTCIRDRLNRLRARGLIVRDGRGGHHHPFVFKIAPRGAATTRAHHAGLLALGRKPQDKRREILRTMNYRPLAMSHLRASPTRRRPLCEWSSCADCRGLAGYCGWGRMECCNSCTGQDAAFE
jgi:hypothetical protein